MTSSEKTTDNTALFLPDAERDDVHIVDVLNEERCKSFAGHWSWPFLLQILYGMKG